MNSAVILLSGGLDSVISLAHIKEYCNNIIALTFNYGQKSFLSEENASKRIAKYYSIKHEIIKLDWLNKISNSSLNTKEKIPDISFDNLDNTEVSSKTAKSVWVPNRNGLFVNIAACYADAMNFEHIVIGANKEEGATFKDNTIEFINSVNEALLNSTDCNVQLSAPLINMTKKEIVKEGIRLNAPFELIHSCYLDGDKNCGKCESCKRLKRALKLNDRNDIIDKIFI
ncbi:MAG: 7-cyano-7-deazaguanine synthase QueC [Candidatus Gastranaerophilales bacterium]|nr:7-cyano-7-deazaguanine synthase QueC [Candidatus Gastranaerophilales bacterium]